jgi:hypothetical protein
VRNIAHTVADAILLLDLGVKRLHFASHLEDKIQQRGRPNFRSAAGRPAARIRPSNLVDKVTEVMNDLDNRVRRFVQIDNMSDTVS